MVDATSFVSKKNEYITVEEISNAKTLEDKRCIIYAEAYFEEYPEKTKTDGTVMKASKKLVVPVSMKESPRLLRLNRAANTALVAELRTGETKQWVGAVLQLGVAGTGMPYINPTVISLPKK